MYKILFIVFMTIFANAQNEFFQEILQNANELYYDDNDDKSSFPLYQSAAQKGSIEAKAQLLKMYYYGIGVKKNLQKAKEIYNQGIIEKLKKLAQNDNSFAQYLYGYFLEHGIFIEKNQIEAIRWYTKAFMQGNSTAANNLGTIYKNMGRCKEALYLYEAAIKKDNPTAIYNLGSLYENGSCVRKDIKKAIAYYRQVSYNTPIAAKRLRQLENKLYLQEKKEEDKKRLLKEKIMNTKPYQNRCEIPDIPDIYASDRAIERFQRRREKFYNCLERVLKNNSYLTSKLINETGGRVEKSNGKTYYSYPKYYQEAFEKFNAEVKKVSNSVVRSSQILDRRLDRRREEIRDVQKWRKWNQMLQESLKNIPHYGL